MAFCDFRRNEGRAQCAFGTRGEWGEPGDDPASAPFYHVFLDAKSAFVFSCNGCTDLGSELDPAGNKLWPCPPNDVREAVAEFIRRRDAVGQGEHAWPQFGDKATNAEFKRACPKPEAVRFFRGAPLSNFEDVPVRYRGIYFPTSEHAYQWAKVEGTDPATAAAIAAAKKPSEAKRLGGKRVPGRPTARDWDERRVAVMRDIIYAKAAQNPQTAAYLASTGTRALIENSPYDAFWGCGRTQKGKNMLGRIWEEVREARRES
jgi:ribA/ribD-fused uncharacterized protein